MLDLKKTTELKYTNNHHIEFQYLDLIEYNEALKLQLSLFEKVKSEDKNFILGLQHPSVISLGHRAIQNEQIMFEPSIPVAKSSRGGLATVHSEGQLVIYPVLNIRKFKWTVRDYVQHLLKTTQKTFEEYLIDSYFDLNNVGVYTKHGKIAFCGVQIKNGISLHGLSINLYNKLELFNQIISCGIKNQNFDSIKNYRTDVTLEEFFERWKKNFIEFSIKPLDVETQ